MHASTGMGLQFHDAMKCMGQGQGHLSERVRFGVSWITGTGRLGMDDTPMSCGLAGSALLLLQAFGGAVVVFFPLLLRVRSRCIIPASSGLSLRISRRMSSCFFDFVQQRMITLKRIERAMVYWFVNVEGTRP